MKKSERKKMTDNSVISYSNDLEELLCAQCGQQFDVDEMRATVTELDPKQRLIEVESSTGPPEQILVSSNRSLLFHAQDCLFIYQHKNKDRFIKSVLVDCPRINMRDGEATFKRHGSLYHMYQYYSKTDVDNFVLKFKPTLQRTDPDIPSVLITVDVPESMIVPIYDKLTWSRFRLSQFVQQLTEVSMVVSFGGNVNTLMAIPQMQKMLFRAEHLNKQLNNTDKHNHKVYQWFKTESHHDTNELKCKFLVYVTPDEEALQRVYYMFMHDQDINWSHMQLTKATAVTPASKSLLALKEQLAEVTNNTIKALTHINNVLQRELDYTQQITQKASVSPSKVDPVVVNTFRREPYRIRINCQDTSSNTNDYYMIQWTGLSSSSSSLSSSSSSSSSISSTTGIMMMKPKVVVARGVLLDPGLPFEIRNAEQVGHDIASIFKVNNEGTKFHEITF